MGSTLDENSGSTLDAYQQVAGRDGARADAAGDSGEAVMILIAR